VDEGNLYSFELHAVAAEDGMAMRTKIAAVCLTFVVLLAVMSGCAGSDSLSQYRADMLKFGDLLDKTYIGPYISGGALNQPIENPDEWAKNMHVALDFLKTVRPPAAAKAAHAELLAAMTLASTSLDRLKVAIPKHDYPTVTDASGWAESAGERAVKAMEEIRGLIGPA
jgi:hypothetical protein